MDIREEIPIKSFVVGAFVCKIEDGQAKFLAIRRDTPYLHNRWQMVGGRLEPGEKGWQAALREIREETGLIPDRFYSVNVVHCFYEVSQNCINLVPIFVAFIDTEQTVQLSSEHNAYKWITLDEVDDYLIFRSEREIARQIQQEFIDRDPDPFLRIEIE